MYDAGRRARLEDEREASRDVPRHTRNSILRKKTNQSAWERGWRRGEARLNLTIDLKIDKLDRVSVPKIIVAPNDDPQIGKCRYVQYFNLNVI